MSEKQTGLASYTRRQSSNATQQTEVTSPRKRGKGETVAITVRLTRAQWERLHQFAVSEGDSLQGLALRGLSMLLREKGLGEL
jgi:hypothetical protein